MKKNLLKLILISSSILLLSGCSFSGTIDTDNNVDENNNQEENIESTYENLDINDSLVVGLYNKINDTAASLNLDFSDYFYSRNKITVDSMDNKFKLYLALSQITIDRSEQESFVPVSDVDAQIKEIFGKINYTNESLIEGLGCGVSGAKYDSTMNGYKIVNACGGTRGTDYKTKITEARQYKDKIEIFEKHITVIHSYDNGISSENICKDYKISTANGAKNFECVDLIVSLKDDSTNDYSSYIDSGNTYKYTFNYDKNDNKYYFYSAEKVD